VRAFSPRSLPDLPIAARSRKRARTPARACNPPPKIKPHMPSQPAWDAAPARSSNVDKRKQSTPQKCT